MTEEQTGVPGGHEKSSSSTREYNNNPQKMAISRTYLSSAASWWGLRLLGLLR